MNPKAHSPKPIAQIILALDVDTIKKAKYFINKLYPKIKIFKVGLELFTLAGPEIIKFIQDKGAEVFLDLKFFDIPNTVSNAVKQAVRLKVKMLTLHIQGGQDMLKAAVRARNEEARRLNYPRPLLIGVTVLTSQASRRSEVLRLTKLALVAKLDGIVCSAREAKSLRKTVGRNFLILTPGIRPKDALRDDQKRITTAEEAIKAGSNFLIIGRPILEAKEPLAMLDRITGDCYDRGY